jgi:transcriptional regulator GlxA family with amidase domain
MLAETDLSLTHVARVAGFESAARFRAAVRRETGLTPVAYREKFRMR